MNTVSIKSLIMEIESTFKLGEHRRNDVVGFIGNAIQAIGCYLPMEKVAKDIPITHGRAKLPCDLIEIIKLVDKNSEIILRTSYAEVYDTNTTEPIGGGYGLNPGYIIAPYTSGTIRIYYTRIPVCKSGYPLIINDFDYKEACKWFAINQLLCDGEAKHPVHTFESSWDMWDNTYLPRARVNMKLKQIDNAAFGQMWNRSFGETFSSPANFQTDNGSTLTDYTPTNIFDLANLNPDI